MTSFNNVNYNLSFKSNKINYIIVYIAYAMGGIYFFYLKAPPKILFFIFLFSITIIRDKFRIESKITFLFSILVLIYILHQITYGGGSFINFVGTIIQIANAYLIFNLLGKKFFFLFVNIVYVFAIIGLGFWFLENFSPSFNSQIPALVRSLGTDPGGLDESLIIFAHEPNYVINNLIIRNNGGFWEPGAYATTLVPAFFFSNIIYGFKNKKSLLIMFTTFTTFSTSGVLALFILLFYFLRLSSDITRGAKVGLSIFLISMSIVSFYSLNFLSNKIDKQILLTSQQTVNSKSNGRFLAFKKAIYIIKEHPLIGKGYIGQSRENVDISSPDYIVYGWMSLLAKIGLVFFSWYLLINLRFYKRIILTNNPNLSRNSLLFVLPFLAQYVLLFGQALYYVPLYGIFFLMSILYTSKQQYILK